MRLLRLVRDLVLIAAAGWWAGCASAPKAGPQPAGVDLCSSPVPVAPFLCDRVTRPEMTNGVSYECAICTSERGCLTTTLLYCAVSCDDPVCKSR